MYEAGYALADRSDNEEERGTWFYHHERHLNGSFDWKAVGGLTFESVDIWTSWPLYTQTLASRSGGLLHPLVAKVMNFNFGRRKLTTTLQGTPTRRGKPLWL